MVRSVFVLANVSASFGISSIRIPPNCLDLKLVHPIRLMNRLFLVSSRRNDLLKCAFFPPLIGVVLHVGYMAFTGSEMHFATIGLVRLHVSAAVCGNTSQYPAVAFWRHKSRSFICCILVLDSTLDPANRNDTLRSALSKKCGAFLSNAFLSLQCCSTYGHSVP